MKKRDYRDKLREDPRYALEFDKNEFIVSVTEEICDILEKEGITRQELAVRMDKTKGFVSQLLNGGRNMTLETLALISNALGYRASIVFHKRSRKESILTSLLEFDLESEDIIYEQPKVDKDAS